MPGAVLGVAQGDRVLMLEAFGVSNTSTSATLATDHLLNIGSAGKAMTSLLIGALIDDGILTWDTRAVDNEYGLGQEISTLSNLTYIGHAGSFDHFNSVMGFYPEKDIAFIFITNGESEAAEDLTEMDGIPHEIAKMLQDF